MRVVILSSHTPSLLWYRLDMMKAMKQKGHEVYALGNEPEDEWRSQFSEMGIEYRQIGIYLINPPKPLYFQGKSAF